MKDYTVISATPTKKGNVCVKLQNKSDVSVTSAFGTSTANRQTTYYVFMNAAPEIGFTAPLDITPFDVVIQTIDGEDGPIDLKYLYPKR
jgi:hypothetical protein